MSPINHPLIARNVDASSPTNAVLAATSSPSPIAHGGQPNIPIWVGYIAGVLLLCAIVAVCYFAYKASRKWRAKVPELVRPNPTSLLPSQTHTNLNSLLRLPSLLPLLIPLQRPRARRRRAPPRRSLVPRSRRHPPHTPPGQTMLSPSRNTHACTSRAPIR